MNEYWKAVVEKDAAWVSYCKYPSKEAWEYYVQCANNEKKAFSNLSDEEKAKTL